MKTEKSINDYYNKRIALVDISIKTQLFRFKSNQTKELDTLTDKLKRKAEIKKRNIESQRAKKLKSIKNWKPIKKKEKPKTSTRYKTKADWYFSRCIRAIWAVMHNGQRHNTCATDGKLYPIIDLTNGHYITRRNMWTRYDPNNCIPQTAKANKAEYHNPERKIYFRNSLVAKYWEQTVQDLESKRYTIEKINIKEIYEHRKNQYETIYIKYYEC